MYFYIYDSFLADKKYENVLARVEARILELGINGKIDKLTILKNLKELVVDAIKRGADTVVAVGDDRIISKVVSIIAQYSKVTLGIIPLGPENKIAQILGIPEGERACDILSKRIIKKVDLGKVNDSYFISSLEITKGNIKLECDGQYQIEPQFSEGSISICNFGNIFKETKLSKKDVSNPQDGILEAVISSPSSGLFNIFKKDFKRDSVFPVKKVKIKCETECIPLLLDGQIVVKTPATVEVAPKKLNIIVGRSRMFQ
jgi:diacylglycerol kinase family enzyme